MTRYVLEKKFKIIKLDMGPNYIIALTKSQHKEILKNPESSAEQAVNQQLIWLQQTSGEYQHWRTRN